MATASVTSQHKTALGRLLQSIGGFFSGLFNSAKTAFNNLTPAEKDAIISGVNISQLIKDNYKLGEGAIVGLISTKTGLSAPVVSAAILSIGKDLGIDTGKIQDVLDHIANTVQKGLTDPAWNNLWQAIAKFGAMYLSNGRLDWVSLSMGLVEWAVQTFIVKGRA